jgi:hypothetical protein
MLTKFHLTLSNYCAIIRCVCSGQPAPEPLLHPFKRMAARFKRQFRLLFSTASNIPFLQPLSFDIDTLIPGGWGGMMTSLVRSSAPAKRTVAPLLCKSPLYFQQLTNCFFAKSFSLIPVQTAPGGWGGSIGRSNQKLCSSVSDRNSSGSLATRHSPPATLSGLPRAWSVANLPNVPSPNSAPGFPGCAIIRSPHDLFSALPRRRNS